MDIKIKIISDCHIGMPGGRCNDFHFNDDDFIAFLDHTRHSFDIVILNGDIWELWETGSRGAISNFDEIANAHATLFNYIRDHLAGGSLVNYTPKRNLYYVVGNHDSLSKTYNNLLFGGRVLEAIDLKLPDGPRLHISHGHECDQINSGRFKCVGRAITWCVGCSETCCNKDIDEHLGSYVTDEFVATAKRALDHHKVADIVIMGHTHQAGIYTDPVSKRIYANCGTARGPQNIDDVVIYNCTTDKEVTVIARHYNLLERSFNVYTMAAFKYG